MREGAGVRKTIASLRRSERAATSIEYGLICALIVLAMLTALKLLAGSTINMWTNVDQKVREATQ